MASSHVIGGDNSHLANCLEILKTDPPEIIDVTIVPDGPFSGETIRLRAITALSDDSRNHLHRRGTAGSTFFRNPSEGSGRAGSSGRVQPWLYKRLQPQVDDRSVQFEYDLSR